MDRIGFLCFLTEILVVYSVFDPRVDRTDDGPEASRSSTRVASAQVEHFLARFADATTTVATSATKRTTRLQLSHEWKQTRSLLAHRAVVRTVHATGKQPRSCAFRSQKTSSAGFMTMAFIFLFKQNHQKAAAL